MEFGVVTGNLDLSRPSFDRDLQRAAVYHEPEGQLHGEPRVLERRVPVKAISEHAPRKGLVVGGRFPHGIDHSTFCVTRLGRRGRSLCQIDGTGCAHQRPTETERPPGGSGVTAVSRPASRRPACRRRSGEEGVPTSKPGSGYGSRMASGFRSRSGLRHRRNLAVARQ